MNIWTVLDQFLHLLNVILVHAFGISKILRNINWYDHLINGAVRIGRDNSTASKIHTLCRKIEPKTTLLALKSLTERSNRLASKKVVRKARRVTVEVLRDGVG